MNFDFPLFKDLRSISRSNLGADLIAGLTVSIMLVPQGMAYALLAGMPPIYGLYGGLIPLILYPILGTCRQLSIGPVAVSALLVLSGVSQLAEPGSEEYIQLVILAGLMIGAFQFMLGVFKLGFLVNFLSHPVVSGFTSAAAIIIAVNQFKDMLGIKVPRMEHLYETFIYTCQHLTETNILTLSICISSMLIMLFLRRISRKIPDALIVVLFGILLSWNFNLNEQFNLAIVGAVPSGLPAFDLPLLSLDKMYILLPTVFTVTLIGIVESIGIAKVLESRHQTYVVRPNQELIALGISKIGGAFFQSLPTSASFTRSAINDSSGAKTGMASIFTALMIGITLLFLTQLFYYLPKAILAAIILLAVRNLFDYKEAVHLWKTHRQDFLMMAVTFVITLLLGIEVGVLSGVILSILAVLYRSTYPHFAVLGKLPDSNQYRNINRFDKAEEFDAIVITRFDDQLYFGNVSYFKDCVKQSVNTRKQELSIFILDASNIHDIDSSGLHALEEIFYFLKRKDITLIISGARGPVRDMLFKSGMTESMGADSQFLNIENAIQFCHAQSEGARDGWSEDAFQTNVEEEK